MDRWLGRPSSCKVRGFFRALLLGWLAFSQAWAQPVPEVTPSPSPAPETTPTPDASPTPPASVPVKGRQGPAGVSVNSGEDPTRPVERFDLRINYESKPNDAYLSQLTLRWDTYQQITDDDWVWYTRLDFPLGPADTTVKTGQPQVGTFGLNDTLFQTFVLTPYQGNVGFLVGARFTLPTATQPNLGKQKWTVAPGLGMMVQLPDVSDGSFVGLVAWNQFDYAGSAQRDHINQLVIKPLVHFELPEGWFVQSQPEITHYNLTDEWFVPLDFMVGRRVGDIVYSLEYQRSLGGQSPSFLEFVEWRTGFFF